MAIGPKPPLLDLSTIDVRDTVRVDGKVYPLRDSGEFDWLSYQAWSKKFNRVIALYQKKTRKPTEGKELQRLLDECCKLVLEAPDAVHVKLKDVQRLQIVTVFFERLVVQARQNQSAQVASKNSAAVSKVSSRRRPRRTGQSSARSSRGSTVEIRGVG